MWACDTGHEHLVRCLLSHGADKQRTDACGSTALDYAVTCGYDAVVQLLARS
jgi:ankyrin repeat protein